MTLSVILKQARLYFVKYLIPEDNIYMINFIILLLNITSVLKSGSMSQLIMYWKLWLQDSIL